MLKIENKKIDEIKPYENNPRNNDNAVDLVANSIKEFGFKVPIIVDKQNVIVAGHTRLKAAEKLGMTEVPVIVADDLTEEQVKAFRLADNKVAEAAEWDFELLDQELADLDMDMSGFGFDLDFEDHTMDEIQETSIPELPEETKTKPGDIYQLGNHRLMCGDSTKPEDVSKLMDGSTMDLIVTDPPYNVNYGAVNKYKVEKHPEHYKGANTKLIENDDMDKEEFIMFLTKAFTNMKEFLKPGGAFYIWYGTTSNFEFLKALKNADLEMKQTIIWNKSSLTLGFSDYQWKHEPCLYGWKEGAAHYFINDRTQSTVIEDTIDIDKMKKEELKELVERLLADKEQTTIINEKKPVSNDLHPTMKPIKLLARLVMNSSKKNEKVLDLFGGSGSTLMACEQLDRNCYMMEYDPHYVDVIIERWENFTGNKAIKIN